jgi:hypothetical protein
VNNPCLACCARLDCKHHTRKQEADWVLEMYRQISFQHLASEEARPRWASRSPLTRPSSQSQSAVRARKGQGAAKKNHRGPPWWVGGSEAKTGPGSARVRFFSVFFKTVFLTSPHRETQRPGLICRATLIWCRGICRTNTSPWVGRVARGQGLCGRS